MGKEIISQEFRYTDVTLPSGAVLKYAEVRVAGSSRVTEINNAQIEAGDKNFSLYISFYGEGEDDYTYNVNGVSANVDILTIKSEIINYVLSSIV